MNGYIKVVAVSPKPSGRKIPIVWMPCTAITKRAVMSIADAHGTRKPLIVALEELRPGEGRAGTAVLSMIKDGRAEFLSTPIIDLSAVPFSTFGLAVSRALKAVKSGRAVFFCCRAGIGRSSTAVLALLELLTGKHWQQLIRELVDKVAVFDASMRPLEGDERKRVAKDEIGPEKSSGMFSDFPAVCWCRDCDCSSPQVQVLEMFYALSRGLR
jgi:hypothetical protein